MRAADKADHPPACQAEADIPARGQDHKTERHLEWLWERVQEVAGPLAFKIRSPRWNITIIAFDAAEKAAELERVLRRRRHEEELREAREYPCPERVR